MRQWKDLPVATQASAMSQAPLLSEMTYMWPRYEPVDMGARNSSRYRLLLYRDDATAAHAPGEASWSAHDKGHG